MMLYPSVSDWWNSMHQSRAIATYQEAVGDNSAEANQRLWDEAVAYNRSLPHDGGRFTLSDEERARYEQTLDVTGTGIMGYVETPRSASPCPSTTVRTPRSCRSPWGTSPARRCQLVGRARTV